MDNDGVIISSDCVLVIAVAGTTALFTVLMILWLWSNNYIQV